MKITQKINPAKIDFYPVLRWLRDADSRNVDGIDWARVYITMEGAALAVYKARGRIAARGPAGVVDAPAVDVVQFYEEEEGTTVARDFFPVDFRNLHARDGVNREAFRAGKTFNLGVVALPLANQRAVPLSLRFKPAWR